MIDYVSSLGCIYQCKDTNFKANHNIEDVECYKYALYLPMQRY